MRYRARRRLLALAHCRTPHEPKVRMAPLVASSLCDWCGAYRSALARRGDKLQFRLGTDSGIFFANDGIAGTLSSTRPAYDSSQVGDSGKYVADAQQLPLGRVVGLGGKPIAASHLKSLADTCDLPPTASVRAAVRIVTSSSVSKAARE